MKNKKYPTPKVTEDNLSQWVKKLDEQPKLLHDPTKNQYYIQFSKEDRMYFDKKFVVHHKQIWRIVPFLQPMKVAECASLLTAKHICNLLNASDSILTALQIVEEHFTF